MTVPALSPTEMHVVELVARGYNVAEVATELGLDERTVEWHIAQARRKLDRLAALQVRMQRHAGRRRPHPGEGPG